MNQTIISVDELDKHLDVPDWAVVDCRFTLAEPERGERDYLQSHIPGAVYAHLDRDLSAPIIPGVTGRHPLPPPERAVEVFSRMGIDENVQVVAYDDAGGSLAAVRVWWMLKWLGHDRAAVLNGGWQAWQRRGLPLCSGLEKRQPRTFRPSLRPEMVVDADFVERVREDPSYVVVDVRAPERYRGEVEPIDPVAGHIPGAINIPYNQNLDAEGHFRSPEELRGIYSKAAAKVLSDNVIIYCGSGVTSIHTILAMVHAGIGMPKLYAGSWSEWVASGKRPVATGE